MSHPGNDEIIDKEKDEMTDPTVDDPKVPFCRAIETISLIKALKQYREGETVTYEELAKPAMGNCAPLNIKHSFLQSARAILFKEDAIEFKAIPNVGLIRMSDSDKIDKSKKALPSFTKKVKKEMHRLASVDYQNLSNDNKLYHNVNMSILNAIKVHSSGDGVNKVTKIIKQNPHPERLALEETLKLFL